MEAWHIKRHAPHRVPPSVYLSNKEIGHIEGIDGICGSQVGDVEGAYHWFLVVSVLYCFLLIHVSARVQALLRAHLVGVFCSCL